MPATRKCCIVGCRSSSRYNPNLQFFQFPRPDNLYHQQWIEACQASMSHILPFKKPVLCSLHFLPHYIGGRRLTSNAVPTLKLDVPSNLKLAETQAMLDEIERSRKFAYINAVVYEWLVRANMNPQLRGSITHGMIKEKAEMAKKIIGCESFMADNRWLNRFRESHLTNFAKKLSTNQLKPMGPSLWIPDIVHDLQHSFPPANVERIENLVNVPEQYLNYMKQYGDYEEDEGAEQDQTIGAQDEQDESCSESKTAAQNYFKNYQAGRNFYEQVQQQYDHNGYAGSDYNTYEDYYQDREQQDNLNNSCNNKSNSRPPSHSSAHQRSSPYTPTHKSLKRRLTNVETDRSTTPKVKRPASNDKDSRSQSPSSTTEINEGSNNNNISSSDISFKIRLPLLTNGQSTNNNNNSNNNNTRLSNSPASVSSHPSRSNSPKSENEEQTANGRTSATPSADTNTKELETYAQAIEYLKPLEDFALFAENFRAIGLLAQLEAVLRKGDRAAIAAGKQ